VLFIVLILAAVTWLVDGRRRFAGPQNLEKLLAMANDASSTTHVHPTKT
jgi:hypothetical protein